MRLVKKCALRAKRTEESRTCLAGISFPLLPYSLTYLLYLLYFVLLLSLSFFRKDR